MLIELSKYEINMILFALEEKPYKDVKAIIAHIKEQLNEYVRE